AFNVLLFLHLWMRFVILPWQRRKGQKKANKKEKSDR
ncbi:DUF3624 domain-containing protein, partial [Vibrio parahaemolyticus]|nr:DUF3624 domain-containing protein [Vibrio parahaemolyticus]